VAARDAGEFHAGEHSKIARLCDVATVVLAGRVIASSHLIREEEYVHAD
jgi:hypothetical protein